MFIWAICDNALGIWFVVFVAIPNWWRFLLCSEAEGVVVLVMPKGLVVSSVVGCF